MKRITLIISLQSSVLLGNLSSWHSRRFSLWTQTSHSIGPLLCWLTPSWIWLVQSRLTDAWFSRSLEPCVSSILCFLSQAQSGSALPKRTCAWSVRWVVCVKQYSHEWQDRGFVSRTFVNDNINHNINTSKKLFRKCFVLSYIFIPSTSSLEYNTCYNTWTFTKHLKSWFLEDKNCCHTSV